MHTIESGYRALGLLIDINCERLLFPVAIIGGLSLGSYIGTVILNGGLY